MCDLPGVECVAANANSGWEPMLPSSLERGNIVLLGLLSLVAVLPIVAESAQGLVLGYFNSPTRSTSENLGIKRYVTAGDRAYEVGTLDGGFPPTGWHIKGRMNGVWASPVRLRRPYRGHARCRGRRP
jgi:hypothetical protein